MIGLLLPLWLNLEAGGAPAPDHHDAPGERYMMCDADSRALFVESDERALFVDSSPREMQC